MIHAATKYPAAATFGLLFGAVAWGVVWYPYRLLEQAGVSGVLSSLMTYFFAMLLGGLIYFRAWRFLVRDWRISLPLALAAGWTNLSYVLAVIDGEVMRIMLLFYLAPLWTLVLARLLLGEQAGKRGILVILLSLTGAFVMLWEAARGWPMPQNTAEWIGLSSGMGFALTNVLARRATHLAVETKSVAVWVGVTVFSLVFLVPSESALTDLALADRKTWAVMVGVGVLLMVTTVLVLYGLTHTTAIRASIIFLFELVVAAASAYWLVGEALNLREWIGGAMIITATFCAPKN